MLTGKKHLMSKPSYRHPPLKLTISTAWSGRSGGSHPGSRTQHEPASTERNNKKRKTVTNMQKYSKKMLCPMGTQQSLCGHVAMKKQSSYTAYPAFLGKRLNRDTTAEWLTSGTENECTVGKQSGTRR